MDTVTLRLGNIIFIRPVCRYIQNRYSGPQPSCSANDGCDFRGQTLYRPDIADFVFGDLMAVWYYRRIAEWQYVLKLLPSALVGFAVALFVDKLVPPTEFKHLMGSCLLVVLLVMFWSDWKGKENSLSNHWWYGPLFGLMGGFTTMIGNAAGPVMAIYLLSVKMPKYNFVGTNAWFFLVVNYLKIPIQVFAWDNITLSSLMLDACTIPFIIIGGVLGIILVKKLPEKGFRYFTTAVTCLSVLMLLI